MKTLSYFVDTHHVLVLLDWDLCPWKSHWIFLWGYRWFCITCLVLLFLRLAFLPWMEKESVHFVLFNRMRSLIYYICYPPTSLDDILHIYIDGSSCSSSWTKLKLREKFILVHMHDYSLVHGHPFVNFMGAVAVDISGRYPCLLFKANDPVESKKWGTVLVPEALACCCQHFQLFHRCRSVIAA